MYTRVYKNIQRNGQNTQTRTPQSSIYRQMGLFPSMRSSALPAEAGLRLNARIAPTVPDEELDKPLNTFRSLAMLFRVKDENEEDKFMLLKSSRSLCFCLRDLFPTFGVPTQLYFLLVKSR